MTSILIAKRYINTPASQPRSNFSEPRCLGRAPLLMSYHWLSTLSILIALLLLVLLAEFATAAVHWDEKRVMHAWDDVPTDWESQGNTTVGAKIKLHFALKSDRENALIDALYEVSNPDHPRHVLLTTPPLVPLLTCATPFQLWCLSF